MTKMFLSHARSRLYGEVDPLPKWDACGAVEPHKPSRMHTDSLRTLIVPFHCYYDIVIQHLLMAVRSQRSICLYCHSRQIIAYQQKRTKTTKRGLETVAVRPEGYGFLHQSQLGVVQAAVKNITVLPTDETMRQCGLASSVDMLRDVVVGLDALNSQRELRMEVLRKLSNPVPPASKPRPTKRSLVNQFQFGDEIMPHSEFRQKVMEAQPLGKKATREVMKEQLLRCQYPRQILRVVAVAMQKKETARFFFGLHENLMRALYRCRPNVSDPVVLETLKAIIMRFHSHSFPMHPQLIHMWGKFAARARSLPSMKRYLRYVREAKLPMSSTVFRSIVAKSSIGHRGLGEIRNGRWKREHLLEVLTGFKDAVDLPPERQYHLGTFMGMSFLISWATFVHHYALYHCV